MSADNVLRGELSDLVVSAQDTFEQVLGWYGLKPYTTFSSGHSAAARTSPMDTASVASVLTRDTASVQSRDSSAEDADVEVDGDLPVDLTNVASSSPSATSAADVGTIAADLLKMQWGSHKKLVGIRFLFPPLDEQMSLFEKARIWVARHDHKYFVDWTEAELVNVESILRPLSVISRDIYKLHMNRSEYCRNVKLKYCLQSDAFWAQEFRENLKKSPSDGGFTGLCQAKIVAAELWRKYSEHYRSHQARHPNNVKSRDVRSAPVKADNGAGDSKNGTTSCFDVLCTDSDAAASDDGEKERDGRIGNTTAVAGDDEDSEKTGVAEEEEVDGENGATGNVNTMTVDEDLFVDAKGSPATDPRHKRHRTEARELGGKKAREEELAWRNLVPWRSLNSFGEMRRPMSTSEEGVDLSTRSLDGTNDEERRKRYEENSVAATTTSGQKIPSFPCRRREETRVKTEESNRDAAAVDVVASSSELRPPPCLPGNPMRFWSVPQLGSLMYQFPLAAAYYTNQMSCLVDSSLSSSGMMRSTYPFGGGACSDLASADAGSAESAAPPPHRRTSKQHRGGSGNAGRTDANSEYRRSERGLSFLFPSFSDHNMSLGDKVQITIARHKNNYFLGWSEEALATLDPLVRPKMPVTPEIYKEYCHRNAMKYDSNLQFAMESTEPWANDFRKKLSLPASEGGFTSLCEVKLEAGRLWREYSGKYRMHNIVKWQMDLNSNTVPAKSSAGLSTSSLANRLKFGSRRGQRRQQQRLKSADRRGGAEEMYGAKKSDSLSLAENGGGTLGANPSFAPNKIGGQQHLPVEGLLSLEHLQKRSRCSSPLVGSFSEGASPLCVFSPSDPSRCRISRSLDNSPSATTGSFDGSVSSPSVDPGMSPSLAARSVFSPRGPPPRNPDATPGDFLFAPLPRQMPVADQLYLWLERHRNSYFLSFPEDTLASLHAYLRPRIPVTRDVFQRHIPESMVDVLGKIEWMMTSAEEWATRFCERVRRRPDDGGFATFEESLTEAVVQWHVNMDRRRSRETLTTSSSSQSDPSFKRRTRNDETDSASFAEKAATIATNDDFRKHLDSEMTSNHDEEMKETSQQVSQPIGRPDDSQVFGRPDGQPFGREINPSHETPNEDTNEMRKVDLFKSSATTEIDETLPVASLHGHQRSQRLRSDVVPVASALQTLWSLRQALHLLCQDNPSMSWEQRVAPFLPVLRQVLGADYAAPTSSAACTIDVVLAVVHRRLEEFLLDSSSS